ncbi:unnamed protein product, partial [Prorocentrum cordatum]
SRFGHKPLQVTRPTFAGAIAPASLRPRRLCRPPHGIRARSPQWPPRARPASPCTCGRGRAARGRAGPATRRGAGRRAAAGSCWRCRRRRALTRLPGRATSRPLPAPRPAATTGRACTRIDLERGLYAGSYGWDNAAYWAISEHKAGIDLTEWYKTRTDAEFYLPEFKDLVDDPETQKDWGNIATFDPMGMYSHPPTIAACQARLDITELKDLPVDGEVVLDSKEIVTNKCAVYYAWNLPFLSSKLDMGEQDLRNALYKYSKDERLLDPKVRTYIPAVGGCTIYTFGDARKLRDPKTEVVVRVHDECIGSDVFGSDICSCRPYLIFALRQAVECAQRGGVGVVVYFRKEGRSLGEVIKFRVYNARINQDGGDRSDTYFHHTESIAGIRDARFQIMMPDVLNWMGIRRIDWLCSMSNEKYEAITGAGITVMQRVDLPDDYIKESMKVELDAKIASGYHWGDRGTTGAAGLEQLVEVRRQCVKLYELGKRGSLNFFTVDESKLPVAVAATEEVIRRRYPTLQVPPHSRLRHFPDGRLQGLLASWKCDRVEKARRLVDLITVSALTDAGAGASWQYLAAGGEVYKASEGLAMASLDMFLDGALSSDPAMKCRANSQALKSLSEEAVARAFQVSRANPLIGVAGRTRVLQGLGEALEAHPDFFGAEVPRPGHIVDYLLERSTGSQVALEHLWRVCSEGLRGVWPVQPNGVARGDVWTHSGLQVAGRPGGDVVPFHKLTQWLVYSLIDALQVSLGLEVTGAEQLTCLPEYRNGGLLLDAGVIALKDPAWQSQQVNVSTELVVEWRALTVALVDRLAEDCCGGSWASLRSSCPWPASWRAARGRRAARWRGRSGRTAPRRSPSGWTAPSSERARGGTVLPGPPRFPTRSRRDRNQDGRPRQLSFGGPLRRHGGVQLGGAPSSSCRMVSLRLAPSSREARHEHR